MRRPLWRLLVEGGGDLRCDFARCGPERAFALGVETCGGCADGDCAERLPVLADDRGAEARHSDLRLAVLLGPAAGFRDLDFADEVLGRLDRAVGQRLDVERVDKRALP